MSIEETPHGPAPDPRLASALRSLGEEPPLESVDWEALRVSVAARAELPLSRLRKRAGAEPFPARGRAAARVPRPLAPLAAAAGIALAVWLGTGGDGAPDALAPGRVSAEEVFQSNLSEQEFRLLVTGGADPEALLLLALEER